MGKFAIAAISLIIGINADHPIETYLLKNPASGKSTGGGLKSA